MIIINHEHCMYQINMILLLALLHLCQTIIFVAILQSFYAVAVVLNISVVIVVEDCGCSVRVSLMHTHAECNHRACLIIAAEHMHGNPV